MLWVRRKGGRRLEPPATYIRPSKPTARGGRRVLCRVGNAAAAAGDACEAPDATNSAGSWRASVDVLGLRGGVDGGGRLVLAACDAQQQGRHGVEPFVYRLQVAAHRSHVHREGAQDTRLMRLGCERERHCQYNKYGGHDGERGGDRRVDGPPGAVCGWARWETIDSQEQNFEASGED